MERTLINAANNALCVLSACNLSGIIHSWDRDIKLIHDASSTKYLNPNDYELNPNYRLNVHIGYPMTSTTDNNRHPINRMYASQVIQLTGAGDADTRDNWDESYKLCVKLANYRIIRVCFRRYRFNNDIADGIEEIEQGIDDLWFIEPENFNEKSITYDGYQDSKLYLKELIQNTIECLISQGFLQASSSDFHEGIWYEVHKSNDGTSEYYEKGIIEDRTYHLIGYTETEEKAIYEAIKTEQGIL